MIRIITDTRTVDVELQLPNLTREIVEVNVDELDGILADGTRISLDFEDAAILKRVQPLMKAYRKANRVERRVIQKHLDLYADADVVAVVSHRD